LKIDEEKLKEILNKAKPFFIAASKELKRGFNFSGSTISNEIKSDCTIKIENDIKI
jgi:hypothetical protein